MRPSFAVSPNSSAIAATPIASCPSFTGCSGASAAGGGWFPVHWLPEGGGGGRSYLMRRLVVVSAGLLSVLVAQGAEMDLNSQAFRPGGMIPAKYTCDGADISPPLTLPDPPAGTKSFALIMDDPDAPVGTWVHWVIWNIPATNSAPEENIPKTAP